MDGHATIRRRGFLAAGGGLAAAAALGSATEVESARRLRITGFELLPVRATERTVWLLVRLRTDAGLTGLGEASDAFGFANTTRQDAERMQSELRRYFALVDDKSPLEMGSYRRQAGDMASRGGLVSATAYSAIEQALWDLTGKALGVAVSTLLGGRLRDELTVYANINRATNPRTPAGFAAAAKAAVYDGFRAVKAAPFDGFPAAGSPAADVEAATAQGVACVAAMREAIGPDVELMVDCHSFFDAARAERVARELEPYRLAWYEEPMAPERADELRELSERTDLPLAGGELLYGVAGFAQLARDRAVDVIMPDVKHCGGLLELTRIAAAAEASDVAVAPHNPSGPVSTAATAQACATLPNFRTLEYQWGEADWRADVVNPPERFEKGVIRVADRPGFGIELNDDVVGKRLM
jgi:galactonate dehydratase